MVSVSPVPDDKCEFIYKAVFGTRNLAQGIDVALMVDGLPVGAARVSFGEDAATLEAVALLSEFRGCGYGDFLTRSVMNAYTANIPTFYIGYVSSYFDKFGFSRQGDRMVIASDKIVFPSKCGCH